MRSRPSPAGGIPWRRRDTLAGLGRASRRARLRCMAARMKTLTELSGITLRTAAAAIAAAKRSLPREEPPAAVAATAVPAPAEAAPAEGEAAPATQAAAPAEPGPPPAPPPSRPAEEVESETVKAALDAAVASATGLSGDRLDRLRDAVKAAGRHIDDVRLVRVFSAEEPVPGAKTLNGFQYLVDVAPASMRQVPTMQKEKRGRGGPGGGGGRGGGGGKGAPTSGGFSMDSLKEDCKGQRSGPGGGRGRPGGGKPGGGPPR